MGNRFYSGKGLPQDEKKAVFWWAKAAQSGNAEAQNNLGEAYFEGKGIAIDYELAMSWWNKAAAQNNSKAMMHIANTITNPPVDSIKVDLVTARFWWMKAAELGESYAMYRVGDIYERGVGHTQVMLDQAFKWYKLAAQKGSEEAQNSLKKFKKTISGKIKYSK